MNPPLLPRLWCFAVPLVLTACAGNGAPAALTAASASASCGELRFQQEALARINRFRAATRLCGQRGYFRAVRPLAWNPRLAEVATAHSQSMAQHDYFHHTSPEGGTPGRRLTGGGYAWTAVAENIAAGQPSVARVVAGWAASPGHCANLMSPAVTEMGLACVPADDGGTYSNYWTLILARPR